MAKQTFTLRHDIRLGGTHLNAGQTVSLDPEDAGDAKVLADLKASDRIALPKTKWRLRSEVTVDGRKMPAGTVVELDSEVPADAKMLVALSGHVEEVPAPVEVTTKPSQTAAVKAAESAGAAPKAQTTPHMGSALTPVSKTSAEVRADVAAEKKADAAEAKADAAAARADARK